MVQKSLSLLIILMHHCIVCCHLTHLFTGVCIEYLPPCSPDLNPIEDTFSKIKHLLRHYQEYQKEQCGRVTSPTHQPHPFSISSSALGSASLTVLQSIFTCYVFAHVSASLAFVPTAPLSMGRMVLGFQLISHLTFL